MNNSLELKQKILFDDNSIVANARQIAILSFMNRYEKADRDEKKRLLLDFEIENKEFFQLNTINKTIT